ncbi:MAG: hypothetical protein JO073_02525 [Actinobacteria bacterium]|nr:hypothetical protein [Actinomycetota bacterium]
MGGLRVVVAAAAAVLAVLLSAATAPAATRTLVPSLTPQATQTLWTQLVRRRREGRLPLAARDCRPLRAVFYAQDDWLRLATKLAANESPCAQYFVSVPPLAADKTALRTGQASKIRALGPNFHALAELNYAGWSKWVAAGNGSWYQAGVTFRQRMAAAGFDVGAGDSWALNELSSGVRRGDPNARQNVEDLVRGLYDAGGGGPFVKGTVFDIGMDQGTASLSAYKAALASWLLDSTFWQAMSSYVSDFSQESYGDVRLYAVSGAATDARIQHVNAYLAHPLALAAAAPPDAATALAYLQQAYQPLANAAWIWDSAYGFTDVPLQTMQDYVTAQVAAARTLSQQSGWPVDRFGFAWAPRMQGNAAWTAQFASDSGALLDRLAAAIHDSDQSPTNACGTAWCTATVGGAAFTESWSAFSSWPFQLSLPAPAQVQAGQPAQLSVQLLTNGVQQALTAPLQVTLATNSAGAGFATSAAGPFASTLTVTIPTGNSGVSFFYDDPNAGTPTLTATGFGALAASQAVTVAAAAPPPDLRVALTATPATAPPAGKPLTIVATVTNASPTASTAATLQLTLPPAFALTGTTGATCTQAAQTLTCPLPGVAATPVQVSVTGTVGAAGEQDVSAVVTSTAPAETNATDNTAALRVVPAVPQLVAKPRITGQAIVGSTLRVVAPRFTRAPSSVRFQWQRCSGGSCASMRGATGSRLRLGAGLARATLRVLTTASFGTTSLRVVSPAIRVRRSL